MLMLDIKNNPWLGLASYKVQDAELFHGREVETDALSEIIRKNYSTIIYGKSGMGKTSLINAGLIPALSATGFVPLSIKLEHNGSVSYSDQIIQAVRSSVESAGGEVETSGLLGEDVPSDCRLWAFFHTSVFWSADNHRVTPVVFIDQFEEIFTIAGDRQKVKEFFNILSELFQPLPPDGISGQIEAQGLHLDFSESANFRLVLSMREDFLARLEDYSRDVPILKRNRVGLSAMNGLQALEVMMDPAPGLVDRAVAIRILRKICKDDRITDDEESLRNLDVETFILSLFCSQLYKKAVELRQDHITVGIVERFGENIINDYYTECVKSISRTSLKYLEEHLLTASGYRNMLAYEDVVPQHVSKEEIAHLEKCRLIRIEVINKTERIEFTHDVLCGVAAARKVEKKRRKESGFVREAAVCNVLELLLMSAIYAVVLTAVTEDYAGSISSSVMMWIGTALSRLLGSSSIPALLPWLTLVLCSAVMIFALALRSTVVSSYAKSKAFSWFAYAFDYVFASSVVTLCVLVVIPAESDYFAAFFLVRVGIGLLEIYELARSLSRPVKVPFSRMWKSALMIKDPNPMSVVTLRAATVISWVFIVCLSGIYMQRSVTLLVLLLLIPFVLLVMPRDRRAALLGKKRILILAASMACLLAIHFAQFAGLGHWALLLYAVLLVLTYMLIPSVVQVRGRFRRVGVAAAAWLVLFVVTPLIATGYYRLLPGGMSVAGTGRIMDLDRAFADSFVIVKDRDGNFGAVDRLGRVLLPTEFSEVAAAAYYRGNNDIDFGDIVFTVNGDSEVRLLDYFQYDNWYTKSSIPFMERTTSDDVRSVVESYMTEASEDRSDSLSATGEISMRRTSDSVSEKIDQLYDSQLVDKMLNPDNYLAMAKYYHSRSMPDKETEMLSKALQYRIAVDSTSRFLAAGNWNNDYESVISSLANAAIYLLSGHIYDGYVEKYNEYFKSSSGYQDFVREIVIDLNSEDFLTTIVDSGKYDMQILELIDQNKEFITLRNRNFNIHFESLLERVANKIGESFNMIFMGEYERARQLSLAAMEESSDTDIYCIAATNLVTSLVFLGEYEEAYRLLDEYRDVVVYNGASKFFRDWIIMDMKEFAKYGLTSDIPSEQYARFVEYLGDDVGRNYETLANSPQYGVSWAAKDLVSVYGLIFGLDVPGRLFLMDEHGERITEDFDDVFAADCDCDYINNVWEYDPVVIFSKDGKRGYYDVSSRTYITGAEFDHAWAFSDGLAGVAVGDKVGFIDETGEFVIAPELEYIRGFDYVFENGYARVYSRDESGEVKVGLVDKHLRHVLPIEYDNIGNVKNGLRVVRKGHKQGVVDKMGDSLYFGDEEPIITDNGYVLVDKDFNMSVCRRLYGTWEWSGSDGILIRITFSPSGSTDYVELEYEVYVDDVLYYLISSTGRFFDEGGKTLLFEYDEYENESCGTVDILSDDCMILTVMDNGNPEQTGQVRRYVRVE